MLNSLNNIISQVVFCDLNPFLSDKADENLQSFYFPG